MSKALALSILLCFNLQFSPSVSESLLKRVSIIAEASKFIGFKYKSRFENYILDCSGFTKLVFGNCEIDIPRTSVLQKEKGYKVVNIEDVVPGDLLIFRGRNAKNPRPGHTAIAHHWSNDTLYFVHSSVSKGITIDHIHSPYWKKRFIEARNIINDVAVSMDWNKHLTNPNK